jgi:hypothetical protein
MPYKIVFSRSKLAMRFLPFVLVFQLCAYGALAQFKYVNPKPGSKYRNRETTIILKNGDFIDKSSVKRKDLLEITGSKSGKHTWTCPVIR